MAKQPKFGKLIRALRQELNLSQEKFAAEFGVTFPTINRWENGRVIPSNTVRLSFCDKNSKSQRRDESPSRQDAMNRRLYKNQYFVFTAIYYVCFLNRTVL